MSLLKNLKTSDKIAEPKDRIGGGGFILDNGIYKAKIEHAYVSEAESKALALNVLFTTEEGKKLRGQFWMTSGQAKGCKNTYTDKEGNEQYLPGFNQANHLCLLTAGTEIGDLETEEKTLKIYNAEAGAEAPTKVPCIMELFGQEVYVAVQRQIVDKTAKGADGQYAPTGETREVNEIDKFFHIETKQTVTEAKAEEEAVFFETWKKEFDGKPAIIRAKGASGTAGAPAKGAAPGAGGNKKPATLFGKKA